MQGRERERARKASKREIRRCFNGLVYQKGHRQGAGPSAVRYSTSLLQDVCFAERPAEPDPFRPLLCDHLYCSPARGGGVTACANCFICRGGGCSSRPRMARRVTAVSGVPTAWAGVETSIVAHTLCHCGNVLPSVAPCRRQHPDSLDYGRHRSTPSRAVAAPARAARPIREGAAELDRQVRARAGPAASPQEEGAGRR